MTLLKKINILSAKNRQAKTRISTKPEEKVILAEVETTETRRTARYKTHLSKLYVNTLQLTDSRGYIGPSVHLEYHCYSCDASFKSPAYAIMKGRGCRKCFSNSDSLIAFHAYKKQLLVLHGGTLSLTLDRIHKFSVDKSYYHRCKVCQYVYRSTPASVMEGSHKCKHCTTIRSLITLHYDYTERLRALYGTGYTITLFKSRLHVRALVRHKCSVCRLVWWDTVQDMLSGSSINGCEHTNVEKRTQVVSQHNRKTYVLRTIAEATALHKKVLLKIPEDDLLTALSYPIPVITSTRGSRIPSFMDRVTGLLVDAITDKAFRANLDKWEAVSKSASMAGLVYRLLVVNKNNRVVLLPNEWWANETRSPI